MCTYSQLLALAEKSARKSISSDLIKYPDVILRAGDRNQVKVGDIKSSGGLSGRCAVGCRKSHGSIPQKAINPSLRIHTVNMQVCLYKWFLPPQINKRKSSTQSWPQPHTCNSYPLVRSKRMRSFPRSTFAHHQVEANAACKVTLNHSPVLRFI